MGIKTTCKQDPFQWHPWFAWYPVTLDVVWRGTRICTVRAWLTTVERRMVDIWGTYWEYRRAK